MYSAQIIKQRLQELILAPPTYIRMTHIKRNTLPWSHLKSGLIEGASSGSTQVHKSDPYKSTMEPSYVSANCRAWLLKLHALMHVHKSDPYKRNTQPWSHLTSGLIEGASSGSTQVHKSDPYKRNTLLWSYPTSGLIEGASSGSTQVILISP